jgi:hypothetical protein
LATIASCQACCWAITVTTFLIFVARSKWTSPPSHAKVFFEPCGLLFVDSSGRSTTACVPLLLHIHRCRPLCIDDCAVQSRLRHPYTHGLHHVVQVFFVDIEPYHTLYSDGSPWGWVHPLLDCSPIGSKHPLPHCFFFIQHSHSCQCPLRCTVVRPVLATPTHAFVPDVLLIFTNSAHASIQAA